MRDLEYENNNRESDCQYENGIKCKNYELCEGVLPPDHYVGFENYVCMTCDRSGFGWKELDFVDGDDECSICLDVVTRKLKFPTKCGHSFCISCSKNILFYNECRYHLSPVAYGCPPCPNECDNPMKGIQCYCYEYDDVQETWKRENPMEYNRWNDEDLDAGNTGWEVFGSKTCPLCKSVYQ